MAAKETLPKIRRRKLTEYLPDEQNANAGTERGLQMIEDSLQQDGAGRSLVADAFDRIPAGNKTMEAAMNAGIEDVIEIETDGKALIVHKRSDWDLADKEGRARHYAYMDNRAAEVGLAWDANQIAQDVVDGVDFGGVFFDWQLDEFKGMALENAQPETLWGGVPEFEQDHITPYHTLKVHFASEADVQAFAHLLQQTVNNKTPYIWYPKQIKEDLTKRRVVDES